ncbi:hypothetical protein E3N88_30894 [Mikania micrantha]|uniref:GAF domain-containing protein n=1 Tax=Mikania micrantha TaxID=192012 RepID=A0A5N6MN40_9ASTR|nr:hypothetical protein E3N88_30894 [Mikania micrantha]
MNSEGIENIMNEFIYKKGSALFQCWQYKLDQGNPSLTVEGQPFRFYKKCIGLERYRTDCLTKDESQQYLLDGLPAEERIAYQRTSGDPNQFMGQLVVPVYEGKKLVGFIELTTHKPKKDYADEFLRLSSLLKREGLATKGLTV